MGSKMTSGAVTPFLLAASLSMASASATLPWDKSQRGDSGMNLHKHHKQSHCKQEKIALWTPPRESAYENILLFFYYVLWHLKHPYPAYVCHIALFNVLKFICLWCCFLFQTPVYSCALACHHPALNPKFVDQIFVSDLHHSVVVHTSTWLAAESTKVCHIA